MPCYWRVEKKLNIKDYFAIWTDPTGYVFLVIWTDHSGRDVKPADLDIPAQEATIIRRLCFRSQSTNAAG